jgi:hypothetical protein
MSELPPLPAGFVLDAPTSPELPPLPPGFVLDGGNQQPSASQGTPKFGLGDTWPAQIAKQIGNALTLPGRVWSGEVPTTDAEGRTSPELYKESMKAAAALGGPVNPAVRVGETWAGAIREAAPAVTRGTQAAKTAADLGAPLPVGVASDSRAIQGLTAGTRQLPLVGARLDNRVAKTVTAAGEAVEDMAGTLAGGVTDRATVGSALRPALSNVIDDNRATIDAAYTGVRSLIDPDMVLPASNTAKVYQKIVAERAAARQADPEAGLEGIKNVAEKGISFNGLVRAKSDLSQSVDFLNKHAGFSNADKKRIGAAMSADLGEVARLAVRQPTNSGRAVTALREAEGIASDLIGQNKTLQQLVGNQRDEGVIGSIINAAQAKTGNVKLLAQLRGSMKPQEFEQIAGVALAELGHRPSTGEFSLNQFSTGWDKMAPQAKGLLFKPEHRRFLEEIATLSKQLKGGDQYANTSNTARAGMIGIGIGSAGPAVASLMTGNPTPALAALASIVGGYGLAKVLSKPAGAATVARWMKAAKVYETTPSVARRASLTIASRDLVTRVKDLAPAEFLRQLQAPMRTPAEEHQPKP